MQKTRGFTLIELLVVIAIIGILSSIVLASLNTARAKGADASIKADLANMRAQAGIFYDNHNQTFGNDADNDCTVAGSVFTDPNITAALAHATSISGNAATCYADDGVAGAGTTASSWAMSVPLKTDSGMSWCVDSGGQSASGTAMLSSNIALCK